MTSRRLLLILASLLALAAVLYIVIRKRETNASKMFEIFIRKEEIDFHRMGIAPSLRQRLSNGELYHEQRRTK